MRKYCEKCKPYMSDIENRIRYTLEEGKLLTNEKCVDEEFQLRSDRLAKVTDKMENKKFIVKFAETITEEGREALKQTQYEREKAEGELFSKGSLYTYIDNNYYENCKKNVTEALSRRTIMPVRSIINLEELVFLNDLQKNDSRLDRRWREYFIIFIMDSLVKDGIVKAEDNLNGILDTHQYGLANGKTILLHSKANNPELDDPDLGECG